MPENFISKGISSLKGGLKQLKMKTIQNYLAEIKNDQFFSFNKLKRSFSKKYSNIKKYTHDQFTTPLWDNFNRKIEKAFLPFPPFSFIRDPVIMDTMFVNAGGNWLKKQQKYLKKRLSEKKLEYFLREDLVGEPFLINSKYLTSHNSVHHLYHIMKFLDVTNCEFKKLNSIVEWGGGYGNLAKIFKRLKNKPITYVIIDTPMFSCLQWLYLSSIFGEKQTNLISESGLSIEPEKINLLPISFVKEHKLNSDLFISTWALSESSRYSQDFVINQKWFNAKNLLIAYQDSDDEHLPDADRIGKIGQEMGGIIEDIKFIPGNHYLFK